MQSESIISIITAAEQGALIDEANEELTRIVEAIEKNGGAGTLTIKVKVAEIKGKDAMQVTVETTSSSPKPTPMARPYFITPDHRLTRKHGAQPDLPIEENTVVKKLKGNSDD